MQKQLAKKRYENLIFDYGTIYRTDYRGNEILHDARTKYKEVPEKPRKAHTPLKDVHTLSNWHKYMSFDVFMRPKGIVDTNPNEIQATHSKPIDDNRELAQNTRPRLIMTPAVSMDDIPEPERSILVRDMYKSDTTDKLEEAVSDIVTFNVQSPFPGRPAPARPLAIPTLKLPEVAPQWRKDCVQWDTQQRRAHCEPTKEFWRRQPVPRCPPCEQSAKIKAQKDKNRLVKNGK